MVCLLVALVLTLQATPQSYSAHSGWSFSDTLETATDILVADVVAGSGLDNGSEVSAKARVRVVRVLKGASRTGSELALEWRYQPMPFESPSVAAKMPGVRGLFFLRKKADGGFEPLQSAMPGSFGGVFVEVAQSAAYPADAPPEAKIAREAGAAIQELIARHAADFGPHEPEAPARGAVAPWVKSRMQLDSLATVLDSMPATATADIFREFSGSSDPGLRFLGLMGRIGNGDFDAILELEKDPPGQPLPGMMGITFRASGRLMGLNLDRNPAAVHALGRLALSETPYPGIESGFAMAAGRTHNPQFLPYLITMLDSPEPSTSRTAVMGVCELLSPPWDKRSQPQGLWAPEMAAYCPPGGRPRHEETAQFWGQWWASHRAAIAQTADLPQVTPPARYGEARPPEIEYAPEISPESRFAGLLGMLGSQPAHYHSDTGTIVEGPPPVYDPLAGQLGPGDQEAWKKAVAEINARLEENRKRSMDVVNAARVQGTQPQQEKMSAIYVERQEILRAGMAELRNGLSAEGWQAVERALAHFASSTVGVRLKTPKAR